jgi:putative ABC transport system permease protein
LPFAFWNSTCCEVVVMGSLWRDLHYGCRILLKTPGFTIVAVVALAIGIGANAAIFSIVNAVLLRPLPFEDPSSLVMLAEGLPQIGFPMIGVSVPDFTIFDREQESFTSVGAFRNKDFDLTGGSEPERVTGARVSASIFPMLGIRPLIGRTYTQQEDRPGTHVVVLSYPLWQSRYGGNRRIVGQIVDLDRVSYTVVGVMPRRFRFPLDGPRYNNKPADLWVPMAFTPDELQSWGHNYNNTVLGRLRPGVTLDQARSQSQLIADRVEKQYPAARLKAFQNAKLHFVLYPFHTEVVGSVRTLVLVLMAAVALVLLIACANVATLLLSRATSRQQEVAIRIALGASRTRLIRQMLVESLLLSVAGGILGTLFAFWGTGALLSFVPASVPLPHTSSLGIPVLAFVAGACCLTTVVFGIAPALQVSTVSLRGILQEGGRSGSFGRGRHRSQGIFVTAEFALALVLLVGAGLLIRSFSMLLRSNPGFRPDHVLAMNIPLPFQAYPKGAQVSEFYKQLVGRVSNLPGVKSCGTASDLPLKARVTYVLEIEGRQGGTPPVRVTWTLGDYFATMGIPLLKGRYFTPEDRAGSQPVAIISDEAAKRLWPGQDPLGKRFAGAARNDTLATIVGIVGNVNDGPLGSKPSPHVYIPYRQLPDDVLSDNTTGEARSMNLAVRTRGDAASMTSAVLEQTHSLDPNLAIAHIETMEQDINSSIAGPRFDTLLLGLFALLAIFLAAIGIYGVMTYTVGQQIHEIGVRMALGAQRRDVMRLVLAQGARLALLGIGTGLVLAFGLTRFISSLLFGTSPNDPATFAAVVIVFIGVALLACCVPALRAVRVDAMNALRHE